MLTETQRATILDDLKDNITFEYDSWDPDVQIYRYKEGFDRELPYVMVDFLPTSRVKFRSISNAIGKATPLGKYIQYGYCEIEDVNIKCFAGEFHKDKTINGRLIASYIAETIKAHIFKYWDFILKPMRASVDFYENIVVRDVTAYERRYGTKVYCYEIDIYLRTQQRWNKVPDGYEEEVVEKIGMYLAEDEDSEYYYKLVE